jgi:hypothetical protein
LSNKNIVFIGQALDGTTVFVLQSDFIYRYASSANIEVSFPEALTKTNGGANDEGID